MNKPYALAAVEELSTSECIGWLDSDILFLGEPAQLILNEGEDFRACCTDDSGGTTGPEHPSEPYWKESCQAVGIDNIEDFPWITAHQQGTRIRLYWNSGVFIYRRSTNLANHYLQQCTQLLNTRLANKDADIGIFLQIRLLLF
jgi:lipopolysaccharide biosynthesis glycosyltransferase